MLNALGSGNVQDTKFGAKVVILNLIMGLGSWYHHHELNIKVRF